MEYISRGCCASKLDLLVHLLFGKTKLLTLGSPVGRLLSHHGQNKRLNRHKVMDDDEISCQIPQNALSGKLGETTYCHILIDLMHLTSSAQKRLSSARALRKTPAELLEAVQTLQKELDEVRRSSERRGLSLDSSLDPSQITNSLTMCQAQSLQYHYVLLVMDINTPLAYPWSNVNAYARKEGATLAQIEVSVDAVARASRSAILATRQIQVNASCSSL